mgnify:CR=1 FL=1|jgi:hypothetical protein
MTYGYITNVFPSYKKKEGYKNSTFKELKNLKENYQNPILEENLQNDDHLRLMLHLLNCKSCDQMYKHKFSYINSNNVYNEIIILLLIGILIFLVVDRMK